MFPLRVCLLPCPFVLFPFAFVLFPFAFSCWHHSRTRRGMRPTSCILNLVAAGAALIACGSSSPTQPGEVATFRVMTFNIQHGLNGAGKYGLNYSAQTSAAVKPDLVGVQELTRNHPSYNCDDQPAKIADMVS